MSWPGGTGRTLCRAVAVRCIRHRLRRHAATIGAIATALVSDTATAAGTTPAIAGVMPSTGRRSYRLFVVLQHLGHGCLHGPAGFLALLAQLAAQGQGGCPGGTGRCACSSRSGRLVCGAPAGCHLTSELTGLVAARQRGKQRERRLTDGHRLTRSARRCLPPRCQAIAHPLGKRPANCAHHSQTNKGQDPDYDRHDETSEDEEREKKRRKRREGT
ncbi:hypothetical protein [uncultured Actinomyces sp.]|uniref:hypothetical protein n=1 Tax=uncultured Actinomyces sp. TaxID=249061 RepID=UPI00260DBF84|nr:hypothetical protein [uncultured Actinomyces sp.]